ncbi:MAG: citramalate synthase [Spirochaetaceae bacterium]
MGDARRRVEIYDTTLRDGTQREGLSLSLDDKLRIARRLDELGVAFIEGGWPGSNPKDAGFFERAREMNWSTAAVAAFGSTARVGKRPEEDANIHALLDAQTPVCTVVGKSWTLHVSDVLRTDEAENLRLIEESVAYLLSRGRRVVYDAEHFFDGFAADPHYALETLAAAARAGAEVLVLCDTNGGRLPWDIEEAFRTVRARLPETPLGMHAHNDGELGTANSLAAVRQGAVHVQGTMNGYGERCGNANLCSIMPDLELKMGVMCLPDGNLSELFDTAHFVAEVANLPPDDHAAYVGRSAFAHKGGIHVAAMRRNPVSYQHISPELVGNEMRIVVSELSGRGNLLSKAEELGLDAGGDVADVLARIKELEARGFSFEAAEASVAMMLHRREEGYTAPFELIDYTAVVEHRHGRGMVTEATIKVRVGDDVYHTASEGNGPVDALYRALSKALSPVIDGFDDVKLADYKVRILDGVNGTAATTRVLVDMTLDGERWSTVGASGNIIEASWQAVSDGIEYGLLVYNRGAATARVHAEEALRRATPSSSAVDGQLSGSSRLRMS